MIIERTSAGGSSRKIEDRLHKVKLLGQICPPNIVNLVQSRRMR
jgi:hypothetical protein